MRFSGALPQSRIKNQDGILAVDFLFAMTIAAVLCLMMFAFATTLSMIEVAQYVAFSTSRAHSAAHLNQERQTALARGKFNSFSNLNLFPSLAPLITNGWFELDPGSLDIRGGGQAGADASTFNAEYSYEPDALPQTGIRFRLRAKILKMNVPLLGALSEEDDFGTWITGLLIREPTSEECSLTMEASVRYTAIKNLDPANRYQKAVATPSAGEDNDYFPMEDNGC